MSRPEFMLRAACGTGKYDPDLWFPDSGEGRTAQHICKTECPVQKECAEYATTFPVLLVGIWGGMGARTIRKERTKRGIIAKPETLFSKLPISDLSGDKDVTEKPEQGSGSPTGS